jgi:hypothetical protein
MKTTNHARPVTTLNCYLLNSATGLYFDGRNFSAPSQREAKAIDGGSAAALIADLWLLRSVWGPHVTVDREQRTGLTLAGEDFTTAGRWVA